MERSSHLKSPSIFRHLSLSPRKCELVLPDDAVPNRQICSEGDCPALGLNWDGETKVPWFKRRQQVEKAKKERDETQLPERFTVRLLLRILKNS